MEDGGGGDMLRLCVKWRAQAVMSYLPSRYNTRFRVRYREFNARLPLLKL